MRFVTLHNLFLYSDPPQPCHPPSYWLRLFSSQTFSRINTPTFSNLFILHTYPPVKMEHTECPETSAYYTEESIQHSEHGESLNSRKTNYITLHISSINIFKSLTLYVIRTMIEFIITKLWIDALNCALLSCCEQAATMEGQRPETRWPSEICKQKCLLQPLVVRNNVRKVHIIICTAIQLIS